MRLYELTNDYEKVMSMLYDDEIDQQMILDTLESLEYDIEDKADNYAKIIREFEAQITSRKEESKRLAESAKVLENKIKLLKGNLFATMKSIGKTKFATGLFNFSIVANGGKQALTVDGEVPAEYTKTIIENDNEKIREALDNGEVLAFAHLEPRGESLRIK